MADEGPNNPSSAAEDTGIGTESWTNETNVYSSNNSWATTDITDGSGCFGKGTIIRTINGETEIENIKVGDKLINGVVEKIFRKKKRTLILITKRGSVITTDTHPFYSNGWKIVKEINIGDPIRRIDGDDILIKKEYRKEEEVYNLSVSGKTFYANGYLVHNKPF